MINLDEVYKRIGFGKFHFVAVLIFGLTKFFDAIQMILLPLLIPILICKWKLKSSTASLITIGAFTGQIFGSSLFGKLSDSYGRKVMFTICICNSFYFSLLCYLSPTLNWVIIIRSIIGAFIGGISTIISTYMVEIMPSDQRGSSLMFVQSFWSLGSYYVCLLYIATVPTFGWRFWLFASTFPMGVIIFLIRWITESPPYLIMNNQSNKAIQIINYIASMNKVKLITHIQLSKQNPTTWRDLFHPNYYLTIVITIFISGVSGLSYIGFVILASIITQIPHKCLQNFTESKKLPIIMNKTIDSSCYLHQTSYTMKIILIGITGEFCSFILAIFLLRIIRRKIYLQILLFINFLVYFFLNLCLSPIIISILIMLGRSASATMSAVIYLYISEIFPTAIRNSSVGFGNSSFKLGSLISSYIVNMVMVNYTFIWITMSYSFINLITLFLVFVLPYETKDINLRQTVDEKISYNKT